MSGRSFRDGFQSLDHRRSLGRSSEIIVQDDPKAAGSLGEKLITRSQNLKTLPERHPYHDERRKIRKMPLLPYLIFYSVDVSARVVNILHFWHGARRTPPFG